MRMVYPNSDIERSLSSQLSNNNKLSCLLQEFRQGLSELYGVHGSEDEVLIAFARRRSTRRNCCVSQMVNIESS